MPHVLLGLVLLIAVAGFAASVYSALLNKWRLTAESWSGIDARLHERVDLADRLVAAVKDRLGPANASLKAFAKARGEVEKAADARLSSRLRAEQHMSTAIEKVIAEAGSGMGTDTDYLDARDKLYELDQEIRQTCSCYNGNARHLNEAIGCFPCNIVAKRVGFRNADYFNLQDGGAKSMHA